MRQKGESKDRENVSNTYAGPGNSNDNLSISFPPPLSCTLPYNIAVRIFAGLIFLVTYFQISPNCFGQDLASPKFVLFGGAGVTNQSAALRPSVHFGADFEEAPPIFKNHFPGGFLFEGGYAGPAASFSSGSALFSANYMAAFPVNHSKNSPLLAFFTGGYTRLFGTGNAVNYGGGVDFVLSHTRALRLEVRDYLRLSGPKEHNVGLRVGYIIYISD